MPPVPHRDCEVCEWRNYVRPANENPADAASSSRSTWTLAERCERCGGELDSARLANGLLTNETKLGDTARYDEAAG